MVTYANSDIFKRLPIDLFTWVNENFVSVMIIIFHIMLLLNISENDHYLAYVTKSVRPNRYLL